MTANQDLIKRLRELSQFKHSDFSIGDEAADALEARKPMTDEEIDKTLTACTTNQTHSWRRFARAVEKHHGIG
ncbi:MAG: hypothetical protein KGL39_16645 [Patescibacteria group bacterium]|nr:hypothetical protein [Patescibacteria group bacterium]